MPNCDFYAIGRDHASVLSYVFDELPCTVYELSSAFDTELGEFDCLSSLENHFGICDWEADSHAPILLQLHPADAGGCVTRKRISLDPDQCDGATFRYKCEGWGLVQLYLMGMTHGELRESHTNHNTEKRATKWAPTYPESEPVANWNWPAITSFSRKLNRHIHKCSVAKRGSRPIMPNAVPYVTPD